MTAKTTGGQQLSLDDCIEYSGRLAAAVRNSGFVPDLVVGVLEGGVLPGYTVATALGVRFAAFTVRRPASTFKHSWLGQLTAKLASGLYRRSHSVRRLSELANRPDRRTVEMPPGFSLGALEGRVLVVDDCSQSGTTLKVVTDTLAQFGAVDVRTGVISRFPQRTSAVSAPDFYLCEEWLQFPWSTNSPSYERYLEWQRQLTAHQRA